MDTHIRERLRCIPKAEMSSFIEQYSGYIGCWGDSSGAPLDVKLLRAARAVEMQPFEKIGVRAERWPKSVAKARGGKVIQERLGGFQQR